jgi:hypothetical protein
MAMRLLSTLLLLAFLTPSAAYAVTVDQIVALSKAGVSDAVILALIDRDKTVFAIEPGELVKLKQDGVSEPLIVAMLRSGRAEGDAAASAASAMNDSIYFATLDSYPQVAIVGHGPERPNTFHQSYAERADGSADSYALPYDVPYVLPVPVGVPPSRCTAAPVAQPVTSTRGIFFKPTTGMFFNSSPVVAECQPAAAIAPRARHRR